MTRSKHDIVILESWMSDRSCQLLQKGLGCRHFFNIVQSSLRQEMEIFPTVTELWKGVERGA